MKILLLIAIALIFTSCKKDEKEELRTNNAEFKVGLLFEVDGCKVYRFYDGGRARYFTNCNGSVQWTSTTSSGKTHSSHDNAISTTSLPYKDSIYTPCK